MEPIFFILYFSFFYLFFCSLFLIFKLFQGILPVLFFGAPYVPSNQEDVKKIVLLANIKKGEKAVDLGSGDGRLVIALARAGAEAHGYEINPFLVWLARRNIRKAGLEEKAFIHWKSFWSENLNNFDIVTVYGIGNIMKRLEVKLRKELKKDSRVVSSSFIFPTWPASKKEGKFCLYEQVF